MTVAHNNILLPIREAPDTSQEDMCVWFLEHGPRYPQAFRMLPAGCPAPNENGTWVSYPFDENLCMWVNVSHDEGLVFLNQYKIMQKEAKMSKELTVQEKQSVLNLLKNNMRAVASVVPKHLTPERLMRLTYQAIVRMPQLAQCSQISLINAVIEAAQLGLEVSGPLGQASIIPFKHGSTYEAVLIVEYRGKIALAYNSGKVKSFSSHPVYEKDSFEYAYGTDPYLRHRPHMGNDKGPLVAAYAVVQYLNGGMDFEICDWQMAMRAKAASPARNKDDSPWNQPANEWTMWVKTAIHQLSKRIPLSPELQRANDLEEQAEKRGKQDIDYVIDAELENLPPAIGADKQLPEGKGKSNSPKEKQAQSRKMTPGNKAEPVSSDVERDINNLRVAAEQFPKEFERALFELGLDDVIPERAGEIYKKLSSIIDEANQA